MHLSAFVTELSESPSAGGLVLAGSFAVVIPIAFFKWRVLHKLDVEERRKRGDYDDEPEEIIKPIVDDKPEPEELHILDMDKLLYDNWDKVIRMSFTVE